MSDRDTEEGPSSSSRSPLKPTPPSGGSAAKSQQIFGELGPPPRELLVLIAILFITYSFRRLPLVAILVEPLRLGRHVWTSAFVWQVFTYPIVGSGISPLFFLVELLVLYLLFRGVYRQMERRKFWEMLGLAAVGAGLAASFIDALLPSFRWTNLELIQGQRAMIIVLVAALAVLHADTVVFSGTVFPFRVRWLLAAEILTAFLVFLSWRDGAGFVGVCVAVALTYGFLTRESLAGRVRTITMAVERKLQSSRAR